jgi:succinate-acetate transporter protein
MGSCWLVTGGLSLLSPPGSGSPALGVFLFFASGAVLVPAAAALFGKVVAAVAFGLAAARFVLTGVYEYYGGAGWEHASGWAGLAVCAVALYAAFAFELEDTRHHTILPVLRWGSGRRAMDGNVPAELRGVAHEAGVREQL